MGELESTSGVVETIFEYIKKDNDNNLLNGCLEMLRQKNWDIRWYQKDSIWYLLSKAKVVYEFPQWAELESFIYGLSFFVVRSNRGPWENATTTQVKGKAKNLQSVPDDTNLEKVLELVQEINNFNKALLQFCYLYKTNSKSVYYLHTHDMLETYHQGEADKKMDFVRWVNLYESWSKACMEFLKLTDEDVIYFQNHLMVGEFKQLDFKKSLPILLAFLDRLFAGTPWWLLNNDPDIDTKQRKVASKEWLFYMGNSLVFTGYTEREFVSFLFGIAVGAKDLPIRSVPCENTLPE